MRVTSKQEVLPTHEVLLVDYATRLARHLPQRRAVRVHLSRLQPFNRRDHHVRIAASTCETLCKRFEGQLFILADCDLVMVVKGASVSEIDQTILKLRFLFSDDPLAAGDEASAEKTFCTWYDLEMQYGAFLAMAEQSLVRLEKKRQKAEASEHEAAHPSQPAAPKSPLDPLRLGRLEQQIATMDITPLLRRQVIAAILPKSKAQPLLNELYVSIPELSRRVAPDVELASDRWLFQHLTLQLDQRLLHFLPPLEQAVSYATAININVATILSPQFLAFDNRLRHITQKTLVLELQPTDIFGDIGAFMFARDFVRDRGYRICLDGLNHLTFPLLLRNNLNFDLYKIVWSPDIEHEVQRERREMFHQAIGEAGAARVILCHCDTARAVEYGHSVGITMFQGRHIDELTQGMMKQNGAKPAA